MLTTRRISFCMSSYSVSQCVAVRCGVLQCVAVCCSVLQCNAMCCSVLQHVSLFTNHVDNELHFAFQIIVYYSVLQCVAVCCGVLQFVTVLQCAAVWRSVEQYVVECCNMCLFSQTMLTTSFLLHLKL